MKSIMTAEWCARHGAREHRIAAEGTTLFAVELGEGPLLVLLSGWPQTWFSWRKIMPALAAAYRVVAVDLPGLGGSDMPVHGYDTGAIALHLDAVLAAFAARDCVLMTHDIGAWVGYAYAARRPECVRQLVLIDAAIPGLAPLEAFRLSPDNAKKIWHFYFNAIPDLPELLITGRERDFIAWSLRAKSHDASAFSDDIIKLYADAYARPGRWSAAMGYYRHIFASIEQNLETSKTPLEMPVLAIGGASGLGSAIEAAAKTVARDVSSSVVAECGHFVAEEQPERLLALFQDFTASTR